MEVAERGEGVECVKDGDERSDTYGRRVVAGTSVTVTADGVDGTWRDGATAIVEESMEVEVVVETVCLIGVE